MHITTQKKARHDLYMYMKLIQNVHVPSTYVIFPIFTKKVSFLVFRKLVCTIHKYVTKLGAIIYYTVSLFTPNSLRVLYKVNGGIMKHLRFLTSLSWTVDRGIQYPCGKTTAIINLSKSQVLVEVLHTLSLETTHSFTNPSDEGIMKQGRVLWNTQCLACAYHEGSWMVFVYPQSLEIYPFNYSFQLIFLEKSIIRANYSKPLSTYFFR